MRNQPNDQYESSHHASPPHKPPPSSGPFPFTSQSYANDITQPTIIKCAGAAIRCIAPRIGHHWQHNPIVMAQCNPPSHQHARKQTNESTGIQLSIGCNVSMQQHTLAHCHVTVQLCDCSGCNATMQHNQVANDLYMSGLGSLVLYKTTDYLI